MGYCYLLHFDSPIAPGRHTCQHYLGYTSRRLRDRIAEHRAGRGARLTEVARERGIGFTCVRTWANGSRQLERRLKNWKGSNTLCPICQGKPIKCRTR
jgi:predicted GIY-YIG superfamily endonuclease